MESKKEELLEIVGRICELEKRKEDIGRKIRKIRADREEVKAKTFLEISLKRDEKGKAIYSNDKLRTYATILSLRENEEYLRLEEEMHSIVVELNKLYEMRNILKAELGISYSGFDERVGDKIVIAIENLIAFLQTCVLELRDYKDYKEGVKHE